LAGERTVPLVQEEK